MASNSMASVNAIVFLFLPTKASLLLIVLIIPSKTLRCIPNAYGLNLHPCRTPLSNQDFSDILSFTFTTLVISLYMFIILFTISHSVFFFPNPQKLFSLHSQTPFLGQLTLQVLSSYCLNEPVLS